ncbi:MAG: extracellular solute-binding protein [Ardenticatenales bacterium]|nr:extracellular solute-binding protein [Ardenticatenales bacterium]
MSNPYGSLHHPALTRRQLLKLGAAFGLTSVVLGGCTPNSTGGTVDPKTLLASGEAISLDILIAEAKKEGTLSTIALPRDWANYGEVIDSFVAKYGLTYNGLHTDYGSAQEIEAIEQFKDIGGDQAPDTVDIGLGLTQSSKQKGLFAPYKVSTWDSIPESLKDAEGFWYGDYYGVMAFQVSRDNISNVPEDWEDLQKPEYEGTIALAGDPTASSTAMHSVWAAGLSRTSSLDDAPEAGIEFFRELKEKGNFLAAIRDTSLETLASGATPIVLHWDYKGLSNRDELEGTIDLAVVVPQTGVLGGAYAQAVSAYAPHPFAARLWMEHLYSDEAQLMWLKGYTHPARYNDLVQRGKVPAELAAKLPPAELYERATFPSLDQIAKATQYIKDNWARVIIGS